MARPRAFLLCLLGALACDSAPVNAPKAPPPPPLPVLSAKPVPTGQEAEPAAPPPAPAPAEPTKPAPAAEVPAKRDARNVKQAPTQASTRAPSKEGAPKRAPAAESPSTPAPRAPSPTPPVASPAPSKAATKVNIPATANVRIEVPAGLAADLDKDPRMQPWVNQVVATIDRCYKEERKNNATMAGAIEILVTMHENERPDADVKSLPPVLSPIVACATGGLMRAKMPLFTGKEHTRYNVRVRFSP